MRKIFKKPIALFLVACFLFGGISSTIWYLVAPGSPIIEFSYERDAKEILDIFDTDWYWLVAQSKEEYSPDFMLKYKAPHSSRMYAGRMHIYVLRENDQLVGFITFYMKSNDAAYLNFVDVAKEFRGKGYAKKLVRFALQKMKGLGAKTVNLITRPTNTSARKLYTRLGFQQTFINDEFVGYHYIF